jgi:hypothetical protein
MIIDPAVLASINLYLVFVVIINRLTFYPSDHRRAGGCAITEKPTPASCHRTQLAVRQCVVISERLVGLAHDLLQFVVALVLPTKARW